MRIRPNSVIPLLSALALVIPLPSFAAIPLPSSPSWTSSDNDYSTGGAFVDLNGDGWLDFITSNGNDMAIDHNGVYMNNQGTLGTVAFWRSADSGFFGHCYVGDVDNDGHPDLAVAYLSNSNDSGERTARIYRNDSGTLGSAPWWRAHDKHSSFDCCLGDVDLDGDLDLAISAGDAYQSQTDSVRIYRNNGGVLDTLPFWTAHEGTPSDCVRFCDIDNDGDLDLFVGQHNRISMYRNNNGTLESTPSWIARTGVGWVLRLAFGDYDNDGWPDLAVACNSQLGDPNGIRVYHNNNGTLDTIPAYSMMQADTEASCVAWADVNNDGYLDLAAGRWYGALWVFENHGGVLDTMPTWSWVPANHNDLVCENVLWGDVTNSHLASVTESYDGDGQRKLFNLHRRPIQFIDSVSVGGVRVPVAGFCSDPLLGWVSFASAPPLGSANVVCYYRYSAYPDLAVTNWDPSHGNHVFLNTTAGVSSQPKPLAASRLEAWPNPASGAMRIRVLGPSPTSSRVITVYDMAGRVRRALSSRDDAWTWDGRDTRGKLVEPGVYFARLGPAGPALKLIRLSTR